MRRDRETEGVYWVDYKTRRDTRVHLSINDDVTLCGIDTTSRKNPMLEFRRESPHMVSCARCKKIAKKRGREKLQSWGYDT